MDVIYIFYVALFIIVQVKLVNPHRQDQQGADFLNRVMRQPMTDAEVDRMEQQRAEFVEFDPTETLVAGCDRQRVYDFNVYYHGIRQLHDPRHPRAADFAEADRFDDLDPQFPSLSYGSMTVWSLPNFTAKAKKDVENRVLSIDENVHLRM